MRILGLFLQSVGEVCVHLWPPPFGSKLINIVSILCGARLPLPRHGVLSGQPPLPMARLELEGPETALQVVAYGAVMFVTHRYDCAIDLLARCSIFWAKVDGIEVGGMSDWQVRSILGTMVLAAFKGLAANTSVVISRRIVESYGSAVDMMGVGLPSDQEADRAVRLTYATYIKLTWLQLNLIIMHRGWQQQAEEMQYSDVEIYVTKFMEIQGLCTHNFPML